MKIKALVLALALTSFAFGQKAAISYVYSIGGNPYGASFHFFIPKTQFGIYGDFSTRKTKNEVVDTPYRRIDKSREEIETKAILFSTEKGIYSSQSFNIGAFYKMNSFLIFQLGVGKYKEVQYEKAEGYIYNTSGITQFGKFTFLNEVKQTNINLGVSAFIKNIVRIGASYDSAPNNLRIELGYVIK